MAGGHGYALPPTFFGLQRPSELVATLGRLPTVPDSRHVGARLPGFGVEALWVVHLGLREGPRAGDRGRGTRRPDDAEAGAVAEVRHIEDGEHDGEGGQRRPSSEWAERADPQRQLFG